jgi:hypothetical protein
MMDIELFEGITVAEARQNPLLNAALIERASIDGDVPEFRDATCALPEEGFRPAIPVVTEAINPILVGLMLERASNEIDRRFGAARIQAEQTALALRRPAEMVVSVPGYVAGEIPEPMEVPEPPASLLAEISPRKARYFTWLSIATTQGRRSLAPAIQSEIARRLQVSAGNYARPSIGADIRWLMSVFGPEDLDEGFSPIENAVAYFVEILRVRLESQGPLAFTVIPAANIPERRFGWIVRTSAP